MERTGAAFSNLIPHDNHSILTLVVMRSSRGDRQYIRSLRRNLSERNGADQIEFMAHPSFRGEGAQQQQQRFSQPAPEGGLFIAAGVMEMLTLEIDATQSKPRVVKL
nr:hypothetical protein CFP56_62158 [Quercus suber]